MICRRQSMAVVAISTSFVLMAWAVGASGAVPDERDANALLQFTAGGHVLGFDQGAIHVASRDHMLRVEMVGARDVVPVAESQGASATPGAAAQPLGRVCYPNAWEGVTVVHESGDQSPLKSSCQVAAGAGRQAIERIRLRYNRPVRVDDQGNLAISYESREMIASDPVAWQETESGRTAVQADYRILSEGEVGFEVGTFDPNLPLVIDGELSWNTFLGGSGSDGGSGIAVDSNGNAYVTGTSWASWGSPARPYTALSDTFVAKLDASGSLVWNTFLGGSGDDTGYGIAVDGNGNAYVTGRSSASWGSPARPYTAGGDAFAAKLDASGFLVWNTFLGGSSFDEGFGIAVDGTGSVYVTGYSDASWGSPARPYTALGDAFAAKLDASGFLVWNTFLGGSAEDNGWDIALDGNGNAYVAGYSEASWGSPARPYTAYDDAFAAKLDASGSLVWNTFLGGSSDDTGCGIAVDGNANAYVTGRSAASWGSPVRPYVAANDAFVAKLGASGSLVWNTFLGTSSDDTGYGIAVDGNANAYVTGYSWASWGSPARPYTAGSDAFVAKLLQNPPGPTITQIKSKRATRGSKATITGSGFSTTKSDNAVYFGKKKAEVTKATATKLTVKIPSNCKKGKVSVYVKVKGVKSNTVQFTVK